jgi:hypothetical protein
MLKRSKALPVAMNSIPEENSSRDSDEVSIKYDPGEITSTNN